MLNSKEAGFSKISPVEYEKKVETPSWTQELVQWFTGSSNDKAKFSNVAAKELPELSLTGVENKSKFAHEGGHKYENYAVGQDIATKSLKDGYIHDGGLKDAKGYDASSKYVKDLVIYDDGAKIAKGGIIHDGALGEVEKKYSNKKFEDLSKFKKSEFIYPTAIDV